MCFTYCCFSVVIQIPEWIWFFSAEKIADWIISFLQYWKRVKVTIIMYLLPVIILSAVTISIVIKMRFMERRRLAVQTMRTQREHNVNRVLVVILVIFILCQSPYPLIDILAESLHVIDSETFNCLASVFRIFTILNSSVNVLVYMYFSKHYRTIFKSYIAKCVKS